MSQNIENKDQAHKKKDNRFHIFVGIFGLLVISLSGYIYGIHSVFLPHYFPIKNAVLLYLYVNIPTVITSILVLIGARYVNMVVHYALHKTFTSTPRSETILKMLYSFSKYIIAIAAVLIILTIWGVDSGALLASAGGLALVVGLGAQSLISDVITGVFIVFEGEFNVGDIVVIDGWRGKVLSIGIRSTKFIDIYGDIKTINNSQITTVINKTKELSMADVVIGINYGESLEKVEAVIKQEIGDFKGRISEARENIKYLGVADLNASSVDLLFITYCKEEHIMAVKRKLRRELKLMFDRHNIEIPYQHVTLEMKTEQEKDISEKDYKLADYDVTAEENTLEEEDFENLLFNKTIVEESVIVSKEEREERKRLELEEKRLKKHKEAKFEDVEDTSEYEVLQEVDAFEADKKKDEENAKIENAKKEAEEKEAKLQREKEEKEKKKNKHKNKQAHQKPVTRTYIPVNGGNSDEDEIFFNYDPVTQTIKVAGSTDKEETNKEETTTNKSE